MKLVRFLMKLANEAVVVELKNNTLVHGTVVGVDVAMNMHLKNSKLTLKGRPPVNVDHVTLRGATIRHVVISDSIPLDTYLIDDTPKQKPPREKPATRGGPHRGRGRGRPR